MLQCSRYSAHRLPFGHARLDVGLPSLEVVEQLSFTISLGIQPLQKGFHLFQSPRTKCEEEVSHFYAMAYAFTKRQQANVILTWSASS